jgi:suppressor for copper-sensitivity B
MILLTSFFGFNLLGLFNFFLPPKLLNILSYRGEGFIGDFITGITLTLLATPCTAPLVGTAVGFALSGDTFEIFSILLIMGIGLSLPLILIMLFPKIISIIPKPGKWLVTFKKIMAIFLLLTSIWLINLLIKLDTRIEPNLNNYNNLEIVNWDINKNISLPNQLAVKGEIVFVDVTADWCLTCQVNKALVLETKQVSEIFKRNNVKVLVLDWTKPNENIKKFLTKKERYGIPYNEIYGPSLPNGKILSELLTIKEIQEYIKKAK